MDKHFSARLRQPDIMSGPAVLPKHDPAVSAVPFPVRLDRHEVIQMLQDMLLDRAACIYNSADFAIDFIPRPVDLFFQEPLQRRQVFVEALAIVVAFLHAEQARSVFPIAERTAVAFVRIAVDAARPFDYHLEHIVTHLRHRPSFVPKATDSGSVFRCAVSGAPDYALHVLLLPLPGPAPPADCAVSAT
ncbi:hypothetical protein [Collimonas fungivorans]|uniref:hypothetical protein n=1 Tax=Collimonas fungivorans TaxID=158899 RepID=UPI00077828C7|nr:hypothetical protein [Collimonas fungivorans]